MKEDKERYKWRPSKVNQGNEMCRVNPKTNYIECRLLKWYEKIIYWKF